MSDDAPHGPGPGEVEEPLVAPPERLRAFLTRPRMFVGFALSILTTVLIVRLFSLHLTHDFVILRSHTREPEFLAYAALCVVGYLLADAAALVVLARVHGRYLPLRPLLLLSLRANFVGGTTSFGGVEIPYQALALRRQGLTLHRRPPSSWSRASCIPRRSCSSPWRRSCRRAARRSRRCSAGW